MMIRNKMVMNQAGTDTGSGGSGGSILTPPPAAPATTTQTTTPPAAAFSLPENWRDTLPDDLKSEPSLKVVSDFNGLVKNYVNAQKAIGAEKVVIPGKHATDADWTAFYQKVGLPQDIKDYAINQPKDVKMDEAFMKDYKENAYKMGVLPKQAQQLMDWYAQKSQAIETANTKAIADQQAKGLDSLKSEWGEAFTKKADQAAFAVKKFGDEATLKFLESTGLGNHPSLIKLFAKVGESLGEDAFHGQSHGDVSTPEEIRGEVAKIMNDTSGPYWNKAHPGHAAAVAELAALNEKLYPNQKKN